MLLLLNAANADGEAGEVDDVAFNDVLPPGDVLFAVSGSASVNVCVCMCISGNIIIQIHVLEFIQPFCSVNNIWRPSRDISNTQTLLYLKKMHTHLNIFIYI